MPDLNLARISNWVDCDRNAPIVATLTDDEIVKMVTDPEIESSSDDSSVEIGDDTAKIKLTDALAAFDTFITYAESTKFSEITTTDVMHLYRNSTKQNLIILKNYFLPQF